MPSSTAWLAGALFCTAGASAQVCEVGPGPATCALLGCCSCNTRTGKCAELRGRECNCESNNPLLPLQCCTVTKPDYDIDPMCAKFAPGHKTTKTEMHSFDVTVSTWDADEKVYVPEGKKLTKWVAGHESDDGLAGHISLHAAHVYAPRDFVPGNELPLIAYGSTFTQRLYEISGVTFDDLKNDTKDESSEIDLSHFGHGLAPSGLFAVEDAEGELTGWITGGGNPFHLNTNPGVGLPTLSRGSVAFMPKDETEECAMLFPPAGDTEFSNGRGKTINTVTCHMQSGVCIFSGWKFYSPTTPLDEDCLFWCVPDNIFHPTKCASAGHVTYPDGTAICGTPMEEGTHFGGAVHGFALGNTDPTNSGVFDLILIFTGGTAIEGPGGVSHMKKITLSKPPGAAPPTTIKSELFGEQLWNDTVTLPYDVGLDHGWVEEGGEHVWISSFRDSNAGVHMLDYETGELKRSLHGFADVTPGEHTYPSGIAGYGKAGQENSFLFLVTSNFRGILPNSPGGITFLFDISDVEA